MCVATKPNSMPELSSFSKIVTELGAPVAIIIWLLVGIIKLAPSVIGRYQSRRATQDKHTQQLDQRKQLHEELLELTEAGSRTYTEEQLTQHLSEVYVEFQEVNKFIRETVSVRLEEILRKLDQVLLDVRDLSSMKERLAEVRMYSRALNKRLNTVSGLLEKFYGDAIFEEGVLPSGDQAIKDPTD